MTRAEWALVVALAALLGGCGEDEPRGAATTATQPAQCLRADPSIEAAARAHVRDVTIGPEERFDAERLDVDVCRTGDAQASATVTIYGLRDDSIRDVRHGLTLVPERGFWQVAVDVETRRCRPGRGPQEFTTDRCV
ncbi:MAG: hypothetical protein ACRDLS_11850 [Solirubrobacteraceae bacterium]